LFSGRKASLIDSSVNAFECIHYERSDSISFIVSHHVFLGSLPLCINSTSFNDSIIDSLILDFSRITVSISFSSSLSCIYCALLKDGVYILIYRKYTAKFTHLRLFLFISSKSCSYCSEFFSFFILWLFLFIIK
jgi:hypothetical protein